MTIFKTARRIVMTALLALPLIAVQAQAEQAKATTDLNVRSGPGTGYAVVDTLHAGEVVTMSNCQPNNWCYITHPGPDGWVSGSYLAPTTLPGSDCTFQLTFGSGGPSFSIVCGDGPVLPGGTPPPPSGPHACFYDGPNYTGDSFCRNLGLYNSLPAAANDRITSVRVFNGAKVRLCENTNMGPFCRDVTGNENQLGGFLNNKVSSLRVYTGFLPAKKQVCLFDGPNYTGQYLCYGTGTRTLPPAAQNRATSIRVMGGAAIRLSKSATYGIGGAYYVGASTNMLPPFWNNQTRSIRVE